ncbi:MAG: hypothetical protein ACM3RX_08335 [Methanococcaceae archaeon]
MKTKIIAVLSFILLCSSSFTNKEIQQHFVGELYGGGIVFFVEKSGKHGLAASLDDVGTETRFFSNSIYIIPDDSQRRKNSEVAEPSAPVQKLKTNEWDGFKNTEMFVTAGHDVGAASICKEYNAGNYTSWYLPAVKELEKLITAKEVINSILDTDNDQNTQGLSGSYWSSSLTRQGFNDIWAYKDGIKMIRSKDNALNVRAIRRF